MDQSNIVKRMIQGVAVILAIMAMTELMSLSPHRIVDVLVCVVTAALLIVHVVSIPKAYETCTLLTLHTIAGLNVLMALGTLMTKEMVHLEDFEAHSVVFPLTAYLLWFFRHMTEKFTRTHFLFGLGVASINSVAAFSFVSVLFQLLAPPSTILDVKIDAMPLYSTLLVMIVAGFLYFEWVRRSVDIGRNTLLILFGLALITSTGALTVRRVLIETMFETEVSRAKTMAEISAHRIENELANLAEAVDRMADRIAVGAYPNYSAWQKDADNYVVGFDALSALGWMNEEFRFMRTAPAEMIEFAKDVGPDDDPIRKETLMLAAETQEVVLSEPFFFRGPTAQVSMMAPIVQNGQTVGMIGNALNLKGLFSEISREVGKEFAYSVKDGERLVFAQGELQTFDVTSTILAMNREWTLTVPIPDTALADAYVWGQRFAFTRILAFVVIVFAIERARLAQRNNRKLEARNSELVAAQTILHAQENEISLMRSSLAHDLKSPIRNIRTVTKMWYQLKEVKGLTDQDLRERILDNLTRLEKLSVSFTDFLSARVALVQKEPLALTEFLQEVAGRFSDRCHVVVQTDGPMVAETDRLLLARVFDNLVENSINASEDGHPTITIAVEEAKDQFRIQFRDNGRGIPAALRERIFKPFDTGDGARRPDSSGLGLTIVRRLIGNLDGTVACVDPGPEGGAAFVIELPKA